MHGLFFYLMNLLDVSMHFCDECLSTDFVTASQHFLIYPITVTVRYLNLSLTQIVVFINSYRL